MSLMGLDIGTTGCKAILFDEDGRILASGYREYPLHHPRSGWVELDSDLVWDMTQQAIQEATSQAPGDPVTSLAISSMGEAVTPIAGSGRPLCRSILGFDGRGKKQVESLEESPGGQWIFENTGAPLSAAYTLPKLMWLKDNMPTTFAKAKWYLCYQDLTAMRLGAQPAMDWSLAGRTLCLDVKRSEWNETLLDRADLDPAKLPKPVPSGTVIGQVSKRMAETLGLSPNCLIAAGGHDQAAGCLGSGVVEAGLAMDATGTVECIAVALAAPVLNDDMRKNGFCCYRHVVPGLYLTIAFNWTGGSLLKWFRDCLGAEERHEAEQSGKDVYEILLAKARHNPSPLLLLPYFAMSGTPHFDDGAKGAILGLTTETTKGDLIKAALEGVSLEMRMNMELLHEAGVSVGSLRAIGGGAKSHTWLQLKADVFHREVLSVDVSEAACLGMAIMAGVAAGVYKDPQEGAQRAIRTTGTYLPNPKRAEFYGKRLDLYRKLYPTTRPLIAELNALKAPGA